MQSRMDKYTINNTPVKSRIQKNRELYEKIKQGEIAEYDVDSSVSVIENNASSIDLNKVKDYLNEKYGENTPKRKSIKLEEQPVEDDSNDVVNTKEYDINAILEKAKKGKDLDYSKDRLKKVREAQYEILNNLDLEIEKVSNNEYEQKKKQAASEQELKDLINTVTAISYNNKYSKDTINDLDLLTDLAGDEDDERVEAIPGGLSQTSTNSDVIIGKTINEDKKNSNNTNDTKYSVNEVPNINVEKIEDTKDNKDTKEDNTLTEEEKEKHIEETLSKLDIDVPDDNDNDNDDFADVSKSDTGAIIIKIIVTIIFILLLIGVIYLLSNMLGVKLFN